MKKKTHKDKLIKNKLTFNLVFLFILGIGILLRVWNLNFESIKLDEAQSIWQASHSLGYIIEYMSKNVHLPLHNTLLHYWIKLFGSGSATVRMLSVIPGVLSIVTVYYLAKEVLEKKKALIAFYLAAVSPFWVWYSREIRMYTLLALLSTLSYLFFIKFVKTNKIKYIVFYTIINTLGIYTHYFFLFVLLVQAIFYFYNFKTTFNKKVNKTHQLWLLIISAELNLLAFIPWLEKLVASTGVGKFGPVLSKPDSYNIILSFSEFLFGYHPEEYVRIILSLWPILVLLSFIYLAKRKNPFSPFIYLLILGVVLPFAIIFSVSILIKPMYLTRYLTPTTPALIVLVAWFLEELKGKLYITITAAFLVISTFGSVYQLVNPNNPAKEDYRGAVNYLMENTGYRDTVAVSPPFTIYPFQYYYEGKASTNTVPIWDKKEGGIPELTDERLETDGKDISNGHKRVFLLVTTNLETSHKTKEYFDMNYRKLDKKQFSEYIWIHVYQTEYPEKVASEK